MSTLDFRCEACGVDAEEHVEREGHRIVLVNGYGQVVGPELSDAAPARTP